jgi:hypothetical protein
MGAKPDYVRKRFGPLLDKTLQNAVAHRIGQEFPRLGGPRILGLCAELVIDVVAAHLRPREHLAHGQVLWMGISVNDPPARNKRTADTDLVPLILDLSLPEDVEARIDRVRPADRLLAKALRLCHQAYEQGALLSNCDLAELLSTEDTRIAHLLAEHERITGTVVPRRATVHDVGSGLTHKRIIVLKRYLEGKAPVDIGRETYHTLEAVDRYLGMFERVRCCRLQSFSPEQTAYALSCSPGLVQQYLAIDRELEQPHA